MNCLNDYCENEGTSDNNLCEFHERLRFDIHITDGGPQHHDLHSERMAMLFRDGEADDYENNCTPLNAAQQRAKELIEAEQMALLPGLPVYATR